MDWIALTSEEWTAVGLSLRVALVATLVSLPFGVAVAMALARGRFWGHSLLNGLVLLPLILPPVVTGYMLLILFGRRGPIGAFLADHFGTMDRVAEATEEELWEVEGVGEDFWPPTYEGAPNTLRVVSFNQAAKRLTMRLQNSWLGQLEADAAARRSS